MRVALLIDLPPTARFHIATTEAIGHAAAGLGVAVDLRVSQTDAPLTEELRSADGVVIGPGSPYRNELAVWDVIRTARERGVPLVGT